MQTPTVLNNRYRVIRILAAGGFGETFLAEDTQMPSGRRCLIKKLKPVANNPQIYQLVQERFRREAAILEELGDGCNQIPKLYAYFVENDEFFLVQEYIEGETLQQKLQQGLLSEASVKEIISSILPILDYVHSKRIVHRDIKPDNILIRHADGKPVLIDFGAVKETMGTVMTASGNSDRSIVIGTPGFMPSEQLAGRPVFSSDIYSLGLTAIYLLTGKFPQQLEIDPATGDLLWRQYALSVTPSFAAFLDKAIASHARDRFASAKEMLESLQHSATPIPPTIPVATPTVVSPPPAPIPQQQPTIVTQPPAPVPHQHNYYQPPTQPRQGMRDWQKAVIIGSVIGTFVVSGLWLIRGQSSQQPESPTTVTQTTPSPTPSASTPPISNTQANSSQTKPNSSTNTPNNIQPSPTPSISTSSEPVSSNSSEQQENTPVITPTKTAVEETTITQEQAKELINNWLIAKRVMFAPPYDFQPANELTTGEEYVNVAGSDGSINSLKKDGHYYKYGLQRIDSVDEFSANANQAAITVKVTEDRTLYDRNGKVVPSQTDFKTRVVRYNLQLVDNKWKIASKTNFTD